MWLVEARASDTRARQCRAEGGGRPKKVTITMTPRSSNSLPRRCSAQASGWKRCGPYRLRKSSSPPPNCKRMLIALRVSAQEWREGWRAFSCSWGRSSSRPATGDDPEPPSDRSRCRPPRRASRENLARQTLARERELLDKRVSAEREVLEAEAAIASAEAAVRAAEARLSTMGFDTAAADAQKGDPLVTVTSPIAGTVMERTAAVDAPVGPDSVLFTVADLSSLWMTVRVPKPTSRRFAEGKAFRS